jgi:hypothetical protein
MSDLAGVLKELQSERDRLDQAINALEPLVLMNGRPQPRTGREGARRKLSVAARRRIAAAQRARWARTKAARSKKPGSHVVSAAARRKMAAAQKARWAKVRSQQRKKAA